MPPALPDLATRGEARQQRTDRQTGSYRAARELGSRSEKLGVASPFAACDWLGSLPTG